MNSVTLFLLRIFSVEQLVRPSFFPLCSFRTLSQKDSVWFKKTPVLGLLTLGCFPDLKLRAGVLELLCVAQTVSAPTKRRIILNGISFKKCFWKLPGTLEEFGTALAL
jgi:hypothetical protein